MRIKIGEVDGIQAAAEGAKGRCARSDLSLELNSNESRKKEKRKNMNRADHGFGLLDSVY